MVISSYSLSTTPATKQWKPKIPSLEERKRLRQIKHETETIGSIGFHHVEFYCGDSKSTASRFALALGLRVVGETGQATGNAQCVSYGLESGDFRLLLTAPYSVEAAKPMEATTPSNDARAPNPLPSFTVDSAHSFFRKHGLAAKAVGIEVKDAQKAFEMAVAGGAEPLLEPTFISACPGQLEANPGSQGCQMAEVKLYGEVAMRFISFAEADLDKRAKFLPHLSPVQGKMATRKTFGIQRIDHAVGNVPNLQDILDKIMGFTGFHEFAEFTAEDVGTVDSGLNSVVLASDSEAVLIPLNEPTDGKRKSQIQTFLEQNEGPGLQHLALKTNDIFATIKQMREAEENLGGFELMVRPSDAYYKELPGRLGDQLTPSQYRELEELGILADADDEGVLLQIFTKPIGDRPTFFFEIIQRIGCQYKDEETSETKERFGCGGFGQGNFRELFKAIEDHEKTLKV